MWSPKKSSVCTWLNVNRLEPVRVLDDIDGPRLFTIQVGHQEFLVYMCGEDAEVERFLVVHTSERIIRAIEEDRMPLRDALTQQAVMCMIDQRRDGTLDDPVQVDFEDLPQTALPQPSAYLNPQPPPLLSVRLIGKSLTPGKTPASVVKRASDNDPSVGRVAVNSVHQSHFLPPTTHIERCRN